MGEGVAEGFEAFAELGAIGGDKVGAAVGEVGALVGIALAVPEGCAEGLLGAEAGEDGGVAGVAQAAAAVGVWVGEGGGRGDGRGGECVGAFGGGVMEVEARALEGRGGLCGAEVVCAPAEDTGLPDNSVALVTAALAVLLYLWLKKRGSALFTAL